MTDPTIYAEPPNPALPISGFVLELEHTALVITDPQIDFLSPEVVSWPVLPEGDGYLAALVNFRFLASAVWTTAGALLKQAGA
jgi:hypothetical protein